MIVAPATSGPKLATPGAVMILAGAFLLYWGLRKFGIVGGAPVIAPTSSSAGRMA